MTKQKRNPTMSHRQKLALVLLTVVIACAAVFNFLRLESAEAPEITAGPLPDCSYVKTCRDKYWVTPESVKLLGQAPFDVTLPVAWDADPYKNRSWQLLLNSMYLVDAFIYRYKNTGDVKHMLKARDYALDWARFASDSRNRWEFKEHDHAVSNRAIRVSVILNWCRNNGALSPDEYQLLAKMAIWHFFELANPKKFAPYNHGLFQMNGLLHLCKLLPDVVDSENGLKYAVSGLNLLWKLQFDKEHMHRENSPSYHTSIAKQFSKVQANSLFSDIQLTWDKSSLRQVHDNFRYLVHPNGRIVMMGDTSQKSYPDLKRIQGDRLFLDAGYMVMSGDSDSPDNSFFIARVSFMNGIHRHADDFSFEWSENGEVILTDAGSYFYNYQAPERRYITSTRAHNTVEISGKNFPTRATKQSIYKNAVKRFEPGTTSSAVLEHHFDELGTNFRREITLNKEVSLTIEDTLDSDKTQTYTQWFHFSPQFSVTKTGPNTYTAKSSKNTILMQTPPDCEIVLIKGQKAPHYQGWYFETPNKPVKNITVGIRRHGKGALIKTSFQIQNLLMAWEEVRSCDNSRPDPQ